MSRTLTPNDRRIAILTKQDWKDIFELRDDLDEEDRGLLRKLIKRTEKLEKAVGTARRILDTVDTEGE